MEKTFSIAHATIFRVQGLCTNVKGPEQWNIVDAFPGKSPISLSTSFDKPTLMQKPSGVEKEILKDREPPGLFKRYLSSHQDILEPYPELNELKLEVLSIPCGDRLIGVIWLRSSSIFSSYI